MIDFSTINNFFDHIYIVTLQRARDRQEAISKNLDGLNFSFFYGHDKNDFSLPSLIANGIYSEVASKRNHRYRKPMSTGQIGCAWSHKSIYEDILEKKYTKVLILEDDVRAHTRVSDILKLIITELPATWELLYLDYNKNEINKPLKRYWYHIQQALGGLNKSQTMIRNLHAKSYSKHLKIAGFHDYTSAYAVTNTAAEKLLHMQTPIAYLADNLLAHATTRKIVEAYIAIPKLFHQLSQGEGKKTASYVD